MSAEQYFLTTSQPEEITLTECFAHVLSGDYQRPSQRLDPQIVRAFLADDIARVKQYLQEDGHLFDVNEASEIQDTIDKFVFYYHRSHAINNFSWDIQNREGCGILERR